MNLILILIFGIKSYFLTKIDLGPNIFPFDANLQYIDKTETPVRNLSIIYGEKIQNKAIDNLNRIILTVRFKNTGRLPGILKINSLEVFVTSTPFIIYNPEKSFTFFVAGSDGETPEIAGVGLGKEILSTSTVRYRYSLEYSAFDKKGKNKPLNFSIMCNFRSQVSKDGLNPHCWFSP